MISARFPYLLFIQVICITYVSYLVNFNFHGFQETQEQYNRKKVDLEQKLLREKAELAKVSDLVKRMGERLGPGFFKNIERFGQQPCKIIGTKESVYIRKELNSHMIDMEHKYGDFFGTP